MGTKMMPSLSFSVERAMIPAGSSPSLEPYAKPPPCIQIRTGAVLILVLWKAVAHGRG